MGEEEEEEERERCWVVLFKLWMETSGGFPEGPWGCAGTPSDLPSQEGVLGLSPGAGFLRFLGFWLKIKAGGAAAWWAVMSEMCFG